MRDYVILAIIFTSLPFCLFRPYIGALVWAWVSYMNPHRLAWSVARHFPVAQLVGGALLLGTLFTKDRERLPMERETILLLLLGAMVTITGFYAFFPSTSWSQWSQFAKVLLINFVTIMLCLDKKKLRYLLMTIALSIGFYGFKGGIFSILTGGKHIVYGPPGSFITSNNTLGLGLLMVLPMLFFLAREEKNPALKAILRVTFFLTIIAIICTYSRGAFLGLAAISFLFLLKSRHKILAAIVFVVGIYLAFMFLPEKWFGRMETIETYEEDKSALGRMNAWRLAWALALDRPYTGGGFGVFEAGGTTRTDLYMTYTPESTTFHNVHSCYFEMLGEHGFIAFSLFLSLFFSSFLSLRKLRKTFKRIPSCQWICSYADMLELSLVAYMVSGTFVGLAYFDLPYNVIGMVIILKVLARREYALLMKEKESTDKSLVAPQLSKMVVGAK